MSAPIEKRHREAAEAALSKNARSASPLGTQTVEFWASLLADQEAEIAMRLEADCFGALAELVRSGEWRGK